MWWALLICFLTSEALVAGDLKGYLNFSNVNYLVSAKDPNLGAVAWVDTVGGIPNIFYYDRLSSAPIQMTNYKTDNGFELTNLCFTPDGKTIFFNSGLIGGANSYSYKRPSVNEVVAVSFSFPPQIIAHDGSYLLTCRGGSHFGTATVLAPGGEALVDISIIGKNNSTSTQLFRLQSGNNQGYISTAQWNPQETQLAFDNIRGDHGFVGLISPNTDTIKWISPDFYYSVNPVWSSDGKMIAFYKKRDITNKNGVLLRTPYKVMVSEVSTGKTWKIWEDKKIGFPPPYLYGDRPLVWSQNQKVLFPTEVPGYLHVFAVDVYSMDVQDLTPGNSCEVQDYVLSYDGSSAFVSHNCDDQDARGIAQMNITTGKKQSSVITGTLGMTAGIAAGGGMAATSLGGIVFIQTTYNQSTFVNIKKNPSNPSEQPQKISNTIAPATGPSWIQPQIVIIDSLDGLFKLHAQLFLPPNYVKGNKYPAVLFTHGGPLRQMYPALHFEAVYAGLYALNQYLAANEVVVLSVNYRMGVGYGEKFRNCEGCGELGAKEYLDVKAGGLWLKDQDFVIPNKIGIYGLSYGGLNTLQGLSRDSDLFSVGVANAPVFNWISAGRSGNDPRFQYMPLLYSTALGIGPEPNLATPSWTALADQNIKLAWESSPAAYMDQWRSPVLVIQGDSDQEVDVQESIGLLKMLDERDVEVESIMYPNESHGMSRFSNQLEVAIATAEFLLRHLTK